jgi:hypothetical protein
MYYNDVTFICIAEVSFLQFLDSVALRGVPPNADNVYSTLEFTEVSLIVPRRQGKNLKSAGELSRHNLN